MTWSVGVLCDYRQFWIGFSWSPQVHRLIIMVLPGLGLVVDFDPRSPTYGKDY
jgi:hypothetical protein